VQLVLDGSDLVPDERPHGLGEFGGAPRRAEVHGHHARENPTPLLDPARHIFDHRRHSEEPRDPSQRDDHRWRTSAAAARSMTATSQPVPLENSAGAFDLEIRLLAAAIAETLAECLSRWLT
jgi:hypothetical protein